MLNSGGGFRYLGYTSAEEVTDRAISWLEQNHDREFFLWIHYMEAHRPFGVHDPSPTYMDSPVDEEETKHLLKKARLRPDEITDSEHRTLVDLYDSDIRYCSRHLSRLFEHLRNTGIWESTNLVFSSDHGEEFGEHGMYNHGNYPYEELISVPLLVKTTRETPSAIADERELVDVAPTVLGFHDVDPEGHDFEGENLFEGESRDVFVLGQPSNHEQAVTLRRYPWKLVHAGTDTQLYNLEQDPEEETDLSADREGVVERLRAAIPEHLETREIQEIRDPEDEVDRQQLAALGYLDE